MKNNGIAFVLFLGIVCALMISGCSNSSSKNKVKNTPKTDTVVINNMKFTPAQLTVNKGDTVVWINKGIVAHTVTDHLGKAYNDTIETDSTWKMIPQQNLSYFCTIHPTMTGTVTIAGK